MPRFYKIFFITLLIASGFLLLATAARADYGSCVEACPQEYEGSQVQECVNNCAALYPDESGVAGGGSPQLPGTGATGGTSPGGLSNVQLPNFLSGVTSISGLILLIVNFLITLAIPFAVLMLVWAGFKFATAQGDPAKLTKARQNLLWTVLGIAVIMASRAIVDYVTEILGGGTGQQSTLLTKITNIINQIIALLFVLVTVYFFWGIVEFVRATGSGDAEKIKTGKKHMIWGIVGMAVMAGAWGIVEMIRVTLQ